MPSVRSARRPSRCRRAGIRPPRTIFPGYWRILSKSLFAAVGVDSAVGMLSVVGIALGGIDSRAHKIGAAGLIMAIVGGALLTPWMADIIGSADSFWCRLVPMFSSEWDSTLKLTQMSLRASFVVPAICFAVVLVYALAFRPGKRRQ